MIVSERLAQYEQMNFLDKNKPPFKTTQINNRRYLGNKYRLLPFELSVPLPTENLNKTNACYNEDSNELVKRIKADLVYIDPPYNSRQYCDAYHLLENIARWEKPDVVGVARKMDRTKLKSDYCTSKATNLIESERNNGK